MMHLSPRWFINLFTTVFFSLLILYLIKKVSVKSNVPLLKDIAESV